MLRRAISGFPVDLGILPPRRSIEEKNLSGQPRRTNPGVNLECFKELRENGRGPDGQSARGVNSAMMAPLIMGQVPRHRGRRSPG
jgi:hypothetical protein